MNIGTQIWENRRKAELTQSQLAKAVDTSPKLSRGLLTHIEQGFVTPSEELAQAILDAIERLKK